ncbi:unnamed protein product [Clonostachys rhizophaga]|uniref:Uncharacterized protein n=1 Tax=Clonostachys rhizophaga TaxID=160324 RepID=A0A9N9YPK4_9HYPO|nr:unnamed protein product [Clonostachys rhizophaga]
MSSIIVGTIAGLCQRSVITATCVGHAKVAIDFLDDSRFLLAARELQFESSLVVIKRSLNRWFVESGGLDVDGIVDSNGVRRTRLEGNAVDGRRGDALPQVNAAGYANDIVVRLEYGVFVIRGDNAKDSPR